jgi:hypothetical protein
LLAQGSPVEFHERVLFRYFSNHVIGDSRTMSEAGQMQLAYFFTAAHIVHQVERIPFAADKSHDLTSISLHAA